MGEPVGEEGGFAVASGGGDEGEFVAVAGRQLGQQSGAVDEGFGEGWDGEFCME